VTLLVGALTIGLILSLLALGIFISFRIFEFPDITADGSITLGAAVAAVLLVHGVHPLVATAAACLSGSLAGLLTGVIHTRFKINPLLSGILVMTALYSINLHVMGRSNVPLLEERTLASMAEQVTAQLLGSSADLRIWGWDVGLRDAAMLLMAASVAALVGVVMYLFFRTNIGTAMQAAGDNAQMIRALGVNVENMIVLGLAVSNGLVALSGALLAQYQGFADVQMGIGMIVWGLASIIIGEALVGVRQLGLIITGAVMGSVLFRLLVAIALRAGLNPNDLKLVTAVFVFAALVLPGVLRNLSRRRGTWGRASASAKATADRSAVRAEER
jgi:putative ABC transport system permease protein